MTGFLTITVLDKKISQRMKYKYHQMMNVIMKKIRKKKTDDEYVSEEREINKETDEEYVDEEEETDEKYIDEEGEGNEKGEYKEEKDGCDNEYYGHYDQKTNYVNV
ncbi:hypothetical protein RCL_jg28076.t1 [Rhizophagus clarus]|uniref:Uncharacterized protein n=2 Tax=Rhizophagus clarus TaxID=94130 RepID=A0A8H3L1N4_9GLOM|nr:hypothetical protein RCL_jg28076.t1 [Rhizophagus clarus]